ncbi:MAG: hypothetical protein DRI90_20755, partial [Deltaproteobacteria bacterium]
QSAASFRAGNLLIHSLNAVLLFRLVRTLQQPRDNLVVAAVVSGWFVLAGVNVEAVTWLSGRFDLLGTACMLTGLLLRSHASPGRRCGAGAMLVAAVLCKEAFIGGVGVYVLHEVLLLRRPRRSHGPEIAVVILGLVAYFAARLGTGVPSASVVLGTGLGDLIRSYVFLLVTYPVLLLAPVSLDQFRRYAPPAMATTVVTIAVVLAALTLLARAWWQARRAGSGDGLRTGVVLFGFGFTLCGFAPLVLTGPNLGMVGERYAYFPSLGLYCALAVGMAAGAERLGERWPSPKSALTAMLVTLPALLLAGQLLFQQTRLRDWRSPKALYDASVLRDPDNPHALYHLGHLLAVEGRLEEARVLLHAAYQRDSSSWRTINALCYVELNSGAGPAAVELCNQAVHAKRDNRRAWTNLASALMLVERWSDCVDAANAGLSLGDHVAVLHHVKAQCLARLGRKQEAWSCVEQALRLDPNHRGALQLRRTMETTDGE